MLVYQRVDLHFPMVFLWFSYSFPINIPIFLRVPPHPKHPMVYHYVQLYPRVGGVFLAQHP
jgi:hypothetical protein